MPLDFSLRFWIVFGSVLVPFWVPKRSPGGGVKVVQIDSLAVQDGLEIVLVRFSCRLVGRDRCFGRLGVVWGSFWGAHGVVLVLLRAYLRLCGVVLVLWGAAKKHLGIAKPTTCFQDTGVSFYFANGVR